MRQCINDFPFIKGQKWSVAYLVELEKCFRMVQFWGLYLFSTPNSVRLYVVQYPVFGREQQLKTGPFLKNSYFGLRAAMDPNFFVSREGDQDQNLCRARNSRKHMLRVTRSTRVGGRSKKTGFLKISLPEQQIFKIWRKIQKLDTFLRAKDFLKIFLLKVWRNAEEGGSICAPLI